MLITLVNGDYGYFDFYFPDFAENRVAMITVSQKLRSALSSDFFFESV